MEGIKTYRQNRVLAAVILLMMTATIFSIDIDKLLVFYTSLELSALIFLAFMVMPTMLLFGSSVQLSQERIASRSNVIFSKTFNVSDISHALYQPTWRGVSSMDSQTNMRTLHIVRHGGGWADTISLTNGAYKERDLADIARRLRIINPRITLDEQAAALIKKYA